MKQKVKISYYSEDFATVGEASYWVDDPTTYNGKRHVVVDRIYCGEHDKQTAKKCEEWENKLKEKYEVIT